MTTEVPEQLQELIRRRIKPAFAEFLQCRSTAELEAHPKYRELARDIRAVLDTPQTGDFRRHEAGAKQAYRFVAWNIERGTELKRQIEVLRNEPTLREADVLLLIETDVGMARSGNVDVARVLAQELGMTYAFAPCYLSLVKGSGVERHVEGDNDLGLHGNAILSRYPISNARPIQLPNGTDKVASREKRLGCQTSLSAEIEFPGKRVSTVAVHLDAQSSQPHRKDQMRRILDAMPAQGPLVLGGDWNTSTYNSSRAFWAIMGFWLRVFMGPGNVIRNHYLHPENWFERDLFRLLEQRGFEYRQSNRMGEHTVYYDMRDPRAAGSLGEWVPGWCFPFIHWSLRNHGGRCPLKLDWFATRGVRPSNPQVFQEKRDGSQVPLSDHDAISVDMEV